MVPLRWPSACGARALITVLQPRSAAPVPTLALPVCSAPDRDDFVLGGRGARQPERLRYLVFNAVVREFERRPATAEEWAR